MIKLGQVLYRCDLEESYDKNDVYKPRLKKSVWVVCKVGKTKSGRTPFVISNGSSSIRCEYFENSLLSTKPNEVVRHCFKTEIAAVRALVEKKNPYKGGDYDPEWAGEWEKDQAMIKRAIKKLRGK